MVEKGAVRLPKILVLTCFPVYAKRRAARQLPCPSLLLCGARGCQAQADNGACRALPARIVFGRISGPLSSCHGPQAALKFSLPQG